MNEVLSPNKKDSLRESGNQGRGREQVDDDNSEGKLGVCHKDDSTLRTGSDSDNHSVVVLCPLPLSPLGFDSQQSESSDISFMPQRAF